MHVCLVVFIYSFSQLYCSTISKTIDSLPVFFLHTSGHDHGPARAQDLDPVDAATDPAHAAVATAGTYTVLI